MYILRFVNCEYFCEGIEQLGRNNADARCNSNSYMNDVFAKKN